jgi:hypothetical protein
VKHLRRRRHLRPRPTRSQIRHQIRGVCAALHAFQLEDRLPDPNLGRLPFLHEVIAQMLEVC